MPQPDQPDDTQCCCCGAITMVRETPEEWEARRFFESLGYVVTRLSESSDFQRADYSVENGVDHFLAEVKSRGPDEDFEQRMERFGRSEEHTSELQSLRHLVC